MSVLKAVVLIDNKAACGLTGEWGLSVYIEYKDKRIRRTGVPHVITGHCMGDKAFAVLKKELGDRVEQLYSGYTFEI